MRITTTPFFTRPPSASALQSRIFILSQHIGVLPGKEAAYVRGIARNRFGTAQLSRLAPAELSEIETILLRRVAAVHPAERCYEIVRDAAEHAVRIATLVGSN